MKQIEVVCALIKDNDNKIFCCKRGPKHSFEGMWEFPGGKVEPQESHEETIIREIKEELDTLIKPIKYITTVRHIYPKSQYNDEFEITMHAYYCIIIEGNLTLSEHTESAFKSIEEMKHMPFADADKLIIKVL